MSRAKVGDLVRYRAKYPSQRWVSLPSPRPHITSEDIESGESQGIVEEVRGKGYFVKEAPVNGDGWIRTAYLTVPFEDVLAIVPSLALTPE